jgi:hypothetical protein
MRRRHPITIPEIRRGDRIRFVLEADVAAIFGNGFALTITKGGFSCPVDVRFLKAAQSIELISGSDQ